MAPLDIISNSIGSNAIAQVDARVGLTGPGEKRRRSPVAGPGQRHEAAVRRPRARRPPVSRRRRAGRGGGGQPAAFGNEILGQIFGSKDTSRTVAANVAESTGIGADQLKAFLPLLALLSAGALVSKGGAGASGARRSSTCSTRTGTAISSTR